MMTSDELIQRFKRSYQDFHQLSTARATEQRKMLTRLAEQVAPRTLTEVTGDDLTEFMSRLLDDGQHANTVRKKVNMVRPFFSWAYGSQLIDAEHFTRLRQVKNPRGAAARGKPRPYSTEEIGAMYATIDARYTLRPTDRQVTNFLTGKSPFTQHSRRSPIREHSTRLQLEAIVVLALHGALRRGEIGRLSLVDMHYDNDYVVVRSARKNRAAEERVRTVPMTPEMRTAIHAWLEWRTLLRPDHESPWLALTYQGGHQPTDPMSPTMLMDLLPTRIGSGWELHRLRHTCGTERLRAGMPIEQLMEFMGHASITETLGYAEIVKTDVHRAVFQTNDAFAKRVGRRAA